MTENTNPFDEANDNVQDTVRRTNETMESIRAKAAGSPCSNPECPSYRGHAGPCPPKDFTIGVSVEADPAAGGGVNDAGPFLAHGHGQFAHGGKAIDPRDVTMNAIANILFPTHRGTDYGQPAGGFTGRNAADPDFDPAEYTVPARPAGTPAEPTVAEANIAETIVDNGVTYVPASKLRDARDAHQQAFDAGVAHAARADAAEQKIAELEADVERSNQHILSARRETRDALEKCAQYVTALSQILEAHDQRVLMFFQLPEPEHSRLSSFVNLVGERANIVVTIARDALGLDDDLVDAEIDEDDAFAMPFEPGDTVVLRSNPPSDIDGIPLVGVIRSIRNSGFGDTPRIDVDWANGARGAYNDSELKHYNTDDK